MALSVPDFDYHLPPGLIAQTPAEPRDSSRLMVLQRGTGRRSHRVFSELPSILREGDLLVVNDTRVIPARFDCVRPSGRPVEALFLRELAPGRWEVMLKGATRCKAGESLSVRGQRDARMTLAERLGQGVWRVEVAPPRPATELLERVGRTPLPPYIRRGKSVADAPDRSAYQTIYAARPGAVAAPTAGLHFTAAVMDALRGRGVELAAVTLHVGLGTFAPVRAEDPRAHVMHSEWYELGAPAAGAIARAGSEGRRVVAVGTTAVRVLEAVAAAGPIAPRSGWTDLFLYPPAEFRVVDALVTNFHLPRSTLVMLVAAFCAPQSTDGVRLILDAYADAVARKYRFYSYGDAMLIE